MNAFLDQLARIEPAAGSEAKAKTATTAARRSYAAQEGEARLLIRRDRAILELLYASGLRVSELTGLNLADIDRNEQMLRVRGKGRKERIVPYGSKAENALQAYGPVRAELLRKAGSRADPEAVFLNHAGRRLTSRSVARIVKKYVRLVNINWDLHPHSLRHAFATHLLADGADLRAIQELLGHRSEEHTSELQSRLHLVCRLLLEKKKKKTKVGMMRYQLKRY